jgi:hypothetical protein
MRSGRVLLAACAAGIGLLAAVAVTDRNTLAFTLGVINARVAADLRPGQEACQAPVAVPDDDAAFDRVVFSLGTHRRPGPALEVVVSSLEGGRVLGRGQLAAGYPDVDRRPRHAVPVGRVASLEPLRVCLRNAGDRRVAVFGAADFVSPSSAATLDGERLDTDLNLAFEREARSAASLVPAMLERATLFRAGFVGMWTYVLLALVVLAGVPWLLFRALTAAE